MFALAHPLAVSFALLFLPPRGLGEGGLLVWLTVFAILVRASMTLFVVPWSALAAELTPDYDERTAVVADRFLLGWITGVATSWLALTYVFHPSERRRSGLFNPQGYPLFAK